MAWLFPDLTFKGDRQYLRGADIFNALAGLASEASPPATVKRINFRKLTIHQCRIEDHQPSTEPVAEILLSNGRSLWLLETDRRVSDRYAFDEDGLVATALIDLDTKTVSQPRAVSATPIDQAVALTKRLNYSLAPDVSGKWLFGQINLDVPLTDTYQQMVVKQRSMLANRYSANELCLDGQRIGALRFIVG